MNQTYHVPVMLNASLEALNLGDGDGVHRARALPGEARSPRLLLMRRCARFVWHCLTLTWLCLWSNPSSQKSVTGPLALTC